MLLRPCGPSRGVRGAACHWQRTATISAQLDTHLISTKVHIRLERTDARDMLQDDYKPSKGQLRRHPTPFSLDQSSDHLQSRRDTTFKQRNPFGAPTSTEPHPINPLRIASSFVEQKSPQYSLAFARDSRSFVPRRRQNFTRVNLHQWISRLQQQRRRFTVLRRSRQGSSLLLLLQPRMRALEYVRRLNVRVGHCTVRRACFVICVQFDLESSPCSFERS